MVFDIVQGGEVFRLLKEKNTFPNDVALFYIAEICLALEFLHSQDIIYRDIKTENILIADDGHIKLSDFGFAKKIKGKTFTMCGSPDYIAPETLLDQGQDHTVDWWALGILLYYFLVG